MSSTKLKEDLSNCLINFDRRVLITELLDEYKINYEQVNEVVQDYLMEQEKKEKCKYEKRFLVHGMQEGEQKKEIYKIVEEAKLNEWRMKLKNVECSLYSVEVTGGAKAAAPVFKPMRIAEDVELKARRYTKSAATNNATETSKSVTENKEVKQENNARKDSPKKTITAKPDSIVKKTSPKSESSATDKKAADKKTAAKKGINNFFAPASTISKKSENTKDSKACAVKPPTPKKMQDFFKKQAEKPKTSTEVLNKTAANTSVQLFDNEEEETEEISSDEEEKLEALKRDIISSDVEMEAEDEDKPAALGKRRRILDSDDEEEDPPVKQEKLDVKEETREAEEEAVAETYLDEYGFVITKKPKQKASNKSPSTTKTPPVTIKASPKETKKTSSTSTNNTKVATNAAAKTKQAQIMNFFSKK